MVGSTALSIKREGANHLLEPVCLFGVHGRCVVDLCHLDFAAVLWSGPFGRRVAGLLGGFVLVLVESSGNIAWHGQVDCAFLIVPIEGDATVEFTIPVAGGFVVLFKRVV